MKKKKTGSSDHFPKEQDARHGSSECSPALNKIAPLKIAPPIIIEHKKIAFFKGYIYTKGISSRAADRGNMEIFRFCLIYRKP